MAHLSITSPLDEGDEKRFEIRSISGSEKICKDFTYRLDLVAPKKLTPEEFDSLLGASLTVAIGYKDLDGNQQHRYINGLVYKLSHQGYTSDPMGHNGWIYNVELSSWLRQLKAAKDCRIFQQPDNTYLKIAYDLLVELGFVADVQFKVNCETNRPIRKYVTQYEESYYDFIVRMLAQDGLLFRFEHSENGHLLVIEKDSTQFPDFPHDWVHGQLTQLHREGNFQPIKSVQTASYDWEPPTLTKLTTPVSTEDKGIMTFSYPGRFFQREDLESQTGRRVEKINDKNLLFQGTSTIRPMESGYKFTLDAPEMEDLHDQSYLVLSVDLDMDDNLYHNSFTAIPATQEYFLMPETFSDKPKISGSQTAIVVGADNPSNVSSEVHGRVKVRFHWDHNSPEDDTWCAGYVRLTMPAAGKSRGFIFTPQIGEEVLISFEDGDPDKPIITGSVYTGNMPLPANPGEKPTRSIIKSHTDPESNQVIFDDKKDNERLHFNAKKDYDLNVLNDSTVNVKNDSQLTISGKSAIQIGKNSELAIDGKQNVVISKTADLNVQEDSTAAFGKNLSMDISKVLSITAEGEIIITGQKISFESTEGDISFISAKNFSTEAGKAISFKSGKDVAIESGAGFSLNASADIAMKGENIINEATKIKIEGSDSIVVKGGKTSIN